MVRYFDQVRDTSSSLMRLCWNPAVKRCFWHVCYRMPVHLALEPMLPVVCVALGAPRDFIDLMSIFGILVISYALVGILAMLGKGSK